MNNPYTAVQSLELNESVTVTNNIGSFLKKVVKVILSSKTFTFNVGEHETIITRTA